MTIVTMAAVFTAGAAFAGALWFAATRVARRRALALGPLPAWMPALCGGGALAAGLSLPSDIAPAAGVSLIGAIVCALVDARTGFIFDALSIAIVAAAGVAALYDGHLIDGVLGVVAIGGGLAALYMVTDRRAIGLGDVKLGSALALGYGLEAATVAIGSAFVLGAMYAVVLIGLGRAKRTDTLRFGPFIAGGAVVSLAAGALGWHL